MNASTFTTIAPSALAVPAQRANAISIDRELVTKLHPVLLRVALRMSNHGSAEDIVQETWVSAMNSIHTYEGRSSLLTWLIAILRQRACDGRRKTRRPMRPLLEDDWTAQPALVESLDARDHVARVERALEVLSERERDALMLCDVRGLDRDEAAAELQITRGHLRVLLHRARLRVREELNQTVRTSLPYFDASSSI